MIRTLLGFLILRRIRARHPELFDGAAALEAVEGALRDHAGSL